MFASSLTSLPPVRGRKAPAGDVRLHVKGDVRLGANVGTTAHTNGSSANLALENASTKEAKMSNVAKVETVTTYTADQQSVFAYCDTMANAASVAPLAYAISICIAEVAAPGLFEGRSKAPHKVARTEHGIKVFGKRTFYRYWQAGGDLWSRYADLVRVEVAKANLLPDVNAYDKASKASEAIAAELRAKNIRTLYDCALAFNREKAPATDKTVKGTNSSKESEGAASDATAPISVAPMLTGERRAANVIEMLTCKPGTFTKAEIAAMQAAFKSLVSLEDAAAADAKGEGEPILNDEDRARLAVIVELKKSAAKENKVARKRNAAAVPSAMEQIAA